jgi:DnaJ-class molecular chaperone
MTGAGGPGTAGVMTPFVPCSYCNGKGLVRSPSGLAYACARCDGTGEQQ